MTGTAEATEVKNKKDVATDHPNKGYWIYVRKQYRKNRLAVFSLYMIGVLVFIALFGDFLANEKPVVAKYRDNIIFPVFRQYLVDLGVSNWEKEFQNISWRDIDFDFAVWPPVPYLPNNLDLANVRVSPFDGQHVPSFRWRHLLGTDDLGRDILAGMIHATRIALSVGIVAMGIASLLGILLGSLAGYFGDNRLQVSRVRFFINIIFLFFGLFYAFGSRSYILGDAIAESMAGFLVELGISILILAAFVLLANMLTGPLKRIPFLGRKMAVPMDIGISRLIEIIVTIPSLILIISIIAIVNHPSIYLIMIVIGLTSWTGIARFIRAELLRVRSLEYIEAAQALGFRDIRIMLRHAIPNALSPVFIAIAFGIASSILVESTLSFLGIGAADAVTWGSLLSSARRYSTDWWLAVFPGFAIFITVTLFNLVGEGLTDALDPRQKK